MLPRTYWQRRIAALDPDRDYEQIYRITVHHEFPWDMNQALSLALFRTYAVPSIGGLLDGTGELVHHTHKRYDDTALLLEEPAVHGLHSDRGRRAIRRINQMHGAYDISRDDKRYVLATMVVTPRRWLGDYGWRPMSAAEVIASVRYYVELGRLMGVPDLPADYAAVEQLNDDYERVHFGFDPGARRVADATLALMTASYPGPLRPPVEVATRALMDAPLLDAFGLPHPPRPVVSLVRAALRTRGRVMTLMPARRTPMLVENMPRVRSYPDGFDVERMGTFPGRRDCEHGHAD